MAGAQGPTVVEILRPRARSDIKPVFEFLDGLAAGKGHRRSGEARTRYRGTHGWGECAAAPANIHGIGVIAKLPPGTVPGPPPDV